MKRLRNIQKLIQENTPMDIYRDIILGVFEMVIVGIFKGPKLIFRVIYWVNELLQSSTLKYEDTDNPGRD